MSESIYNLIPPEVYVPPKPARYKSTHEGKVDAKKLSYSTFVVPKKSKGTFGPEGGRVALSTTHDFTKKHEREPKLPPPQKFTYGDEEARRPALPKGKPVMGLVTSKNFITANAVENILAVPKKPMDKNVDYLNKPDYGKVPEYLDRVKSEIQEEYQYIKTMQDARLAEENDNGVRALSEDERLELLDKLKQKWEKTNKEYQVLSFTLDTAPKKARKERYEAELSQIEKDIEVMSRKNVFVAEY